MKGRYLIIFMFIYLLAKFSEVKSQSIIQLGSNYYSAGIPSNEFEFGAAPQQGGLQRQANWCWAACTQMVLNFHGLRVSQEDIVYKIYGDLIDRPANANQIRYALSGWAYNVFGTTSQIYCNNMVFSANELTQQLAYKWPLIVGLTIPYQEIGHAYVLTAIYYSIDRYNNTLPDKVVLRDPYPGNLSRIELSWDEFTRRLMPGYIFKVWVTR